VAAPLELVELGQELVEERETPDVAHDGDAPHEAARHARELHELAHERRRQVVDAEVAEVLEGVDRLGPARSGHARDDDDVLLHGRRLVSV
jgi:hypothetical protein